eukprot:1139844-Pelagomonas_calceolata.AAC.1
MTNTSYLLGPHLLPTRATAAAATPANKSTSQAEFLRHVMDGILRSTSDPAQDAKAAAASFQRNLALAFSSDDEEADPPQPAKALAKLKVLTNILPKAPLAFSLR